MSDERATETIEAQTARLRAGAGLRELDERVLEVRGEDRLSWLAGMVTQDVKGLAPGASRYAVAVHEKGKILADLWCLARPDALWLCAPASQVPVLVEHFERHIIMEDVELAARDELRVLTLQGPEARALAEGALGRELAGATASAAGRLAGGGVDVVLARDGALPGWLAGALASGAAGWVSNEAWETARLERGVPRFGVDFDTQNYVQEACLTERAVSFKKGCYVGQEVVCRLEMRGHVRRQLVGLRFEATEASDARPAPKAGDAVGEGGALTSVAYSPVARAYVALAMVKWDVATRGGTVQVGERSATITTRPLDA